MDINDIIQNIENNSSAHVYIDNEADIDDLGWYIVEEQAIGINPNLDDFEASRSLVHEVAHHVDLNENNHYDRREIDGEVIAHAVEEIVIFNAPIRGVIEEVIDDIRDAYCLNGAVSVDEEDILEVANRVREIVKVF